MRDSLAAWLRRLADRVSVPPAVAGARAGFREYQFYVADMDEARSYLARREAMKYYRP